MMNIKIGLETFEDNQYQSVVAFIWLGGKDFLLDSVLLDTENTEEDLELAEGFASHWEMIADEENIKVIFDPELTALIEELTFELEFEKEDKEEQQRRDEKNGLYPDKWDDAN